MVSFSESEKVNIINLLESCLNSSTFNSTALFVQEMQNVLPAPFVKALIPKHGSIEGLVDINGSEKTIKIIKTLMHPQVLPLFLAQRITIEQIVPTSKLNINGKYWSEETTIAVAGLMHDPDIEPYVTSGLMTSSMIEFWGGYKTWTTIIPYLKNHEDLIQEGILWLDAHGDDELINLSNKCYNLSQHKNEIKKLLQDGIITKIDLRGFYFHDPFYSSQFTLALNRIKSQQKYFKLRLISVFEVYFSSFDKVVHALNSVNPRAIEAISTSSVFYTRPYILTEKELFEIFAYPEIANLITKKTFTSDEIIKIWKDSQLKQCLIAVMCDEDTAKQFKLLANARDFGGYLEEKMQRNLRFMGNMLLNPKILALVKFKLWGSSDISFFRNWKPSNIIVYFKYRLLMRLKTLFAGLMNEEMLALKEILSQLDTIHDFDHIVAWYGTVFEPKVIHEDLISHLYLGVLPILDILNADSNIDFNEEVKEFFDGEYQRLLDYESIDEEGNGLIQFGYLYLNAGEREKAYECFVRVTEDAADYFEATYEAANIALSLNNIEEAKHFFKKAHDIAIKQGLGSEVVEGLVTTLASIIDIAGQEGGLMVFGANGVKLYATNAGTSSSLNNNSIHRRSSIGVLEQSQVHENHSSEEQKIENSENNVEKKSSSKGFISNFWARIRRLNDFAGEHEDMESKKSTEAKAIYASLK